MSDIGQNIVEEVSPVTAGANLGWNVWEGSYRYVSRQAVITEAPRSDPKMTYPIAEWGQLDPVLLPNNSSAAVGAIVYRSSTVPQLKDRLLFGDMPSGELFHVSADNLPKGGQDPIRRVLFVTAEGTPPRAAPRDHSGEEPRTGQDGRDTRGHALLHECGRTDFSAEQGGWDGSRDRAVAGSNFTLGRAQSSSGLCSTAWAALWPGTPVTPPPGWAPEPHR